VAEAQIGSMAAKSVPRRFSHWLVEEIKTLTPSIIFFLISFGLVLLVIKLLLIHYAIHIEVLTNAIVGALIAAKVALLLDKIGWGRAQGWPPIALVAARTLLYSVGFMAFGILERMIHGYRTTGTFHGAVNHWVANFDPGRFSATVLLVTMVFAVFFTGREISKSLGEGGLYALFFRRPSQRAKA
jgi:hypothetical protein